MGLPQVVVLSSALVVAFAIPVSADTSPPEPGLADTWECPLAAGGSVYTNKERAGCRELLLKPLSVVPSVVSSLENMPVAPRATTGGAPHDEMPPSLDRSSAIGERVVPDWARDWHASVAPGGSVQEEVCSLYSEWLHLVQKTRGGVFYGSDPSYGGDLSGLNQRGASYSFYDNARYIALSRIFGTGFVPVGCW